MDWGFLTEIVLPVLVALSYFWFGWKVGLEQGRKDRDKSDRALLREYMTSLREAWRHPSGAGMLRGHSIQRQPDDGAYVYVDDGSPTTTYRGWCGYCGLDDTPDGYDGCIGELPPNEVANACCGHGLVSHAYVQFREGQRLSGREALDWVRSQGVQR